MGITCLACGQEADRLLCKGCEALTAERDALAARVAGLEGEVGRLRGALEDLLSEIADQCGDPEDEDDDPLAEAFRAARAALGPAPAAGEGGEG